MGVKLIMRWVLIVLHMVGDLQGQIDASLRFPDRDGCTAALRALEAHYAANPQAAPQAACAELTDERHEKEEFAKWRR